MYTHILYVYTYVYTYTFHFLKRFTFFDLIFACSSIKYYIYLMLIAYDFFQNKIFPLILNKKIIFPSFMYLAGDYKINEIFQNNSRNSVRDVSVIIILLAKYTNV